MSNVIQLESAQGSVDDALERIAERHLTVGVRFIAAVAIDADGNALCYQGGDARIIEVVGLLSTMQTRIALEALGLGDTDHDDNG